MAIDPVNIVYNFHNSGYKTNNSIHKTNRPIYKINEDNNYKIKPENPDKLQKVSDTNFIGRNAQTPALVREYGQIYNKRGCIFNRHTTFFARNDLDWYDLGQYLKSKYKDISNVDIQCFGCSTGCEPYTLAILLKSIYGDSPFVIHASDIDKKTIKNNVCEQENGIYLNEDDYLKIIQTLAIDVDESGTCKDCLGRYFIERGQMRQIQPEIVNSVKFGKKNILISTGDFSKTKPTIVLCRNMWPYINPDLYCEFAEKLYENLAEGSIVIIGQFDYHGEYGYENSSEFPSALQKAGFRPIDRAMGNWCFIENYDGLKLVFEK